MASESRYLLRALERSGYVIVVITRKRSSEETTLDYVSPNAETLGMNVGLLAKGLKLPIDYVHPEDRKDVSDMFGKAIEDDVTDYVHNHRLVGDNGRVYNVKNEVTISKPDTDTATIEMYLSEVREQEYRPVKKKELMLNNSPLISILCNRSDLNGRDMLRCSDPAAVEAYFDRIRQAVVSPDDSGKLERFLSNTIFVPGSPS